MKHLKKFEGFNPYDDEPLSPVEQVFGKQTRLEKQFSEIVVNGLMSSDESTSRVWSTFNVLKSEIEDLIGSEDNLFKELQHRIVEGEKPKSVMNDICSRLELNDEMKRLLDKLNYL